jgi:hypothetical protein
MLDNFHDLDCPSLRAKGLDRQRGLASRSEEAMLAIIELSWLRSFWSILAVGELRN